MPWSPDFTTRPTLTGNFGAVASTHWLASAAGMRLLELGGNAFDAAVAAGFTLQVAEPHLNGPGGEVPILFYSEASRAASVICGQGPAPAAASIPYFRSLGLDLIPGTGLLAPCVPAAFDAWLTLLRDHGTLSLRDVLTPAIAYARHGIPVVPQIRATIARVEQLFRNEWQNSAEIYLPGSALPEAGAMLRNPGLAQTYETILHMAEAASRDREEQIQTARDAWYKGWIAEEMDGFLRTTEALDASGNRHRGIMTADDLARFETRIEAPLAGSYHGHTVLKAGAWSQGPAMLQQLAILKRFDLQAMDPLGADFAHTVTEAAKLALADRDAWYGDPDHSDLPLEALIGDAYGETRAGLIDPAAASLDLRPGSPNGQSPRLPDWVMNPPATYPSAELFGAGEPTRDRSTDRQLSDRPVQPTRGDTCHVDVIDRWGNMVSATPSGGWLQSSPVIPSLGFPLGTRMQMFWLEEGLPSSLKPGARPRTTLSPGLVLKDGAPYLAWGTPGGDQQEQWPLLVLLRHLHHGYDLQAAIDAPAFHTDHLVSSFWPRGVKPGALAIEDRYDDRVLKKLEARGHRLTLTGDWSLGRVSAASREGRPGSGMAIKAAANPRGMQGYAICR